MPNHLADETSPYLLQHKDNPVDWYPWGEAALARARERGPPDPALDRLLGLPLVPRDGARVVRGRRDGAPDERAVRVHQARPRGAPGPRLDLHGGLPGDDRRRRLAAERLPHARAGPVLRRHVLPARVAHGHAELARRARGGGRGLGREARRDPRRRRPDRGAPAGRRGAARLRASRSEPELLDAAVEGLRAQFDPANGGFGTRAQVPARVGARVPDAPRRGRDGRARPCARWPRAACTTRSAAASRATRSTPTGSSPTSRRCSTTTRCSRARTCTAGR